MIVGNGAGQSLAGTYASEVIMNPLGRRLAVLIVTSFLGCYVALAETTEPTGIPAPPTLMLGKDTGAGDVVLTWTSTTSPYSVVRDGDPNPSDFTSNIIASGLGTTTFDDPILNDGMDYYYLVKDDVAPTAVYGVNVDGGVPGDSITLTGVGFAAVLGDNQVFIAGEQATVTGVTATTLTFTVPTQSTSGQTIVVTPRGANIGGQFYQIGTQGLSDISSVAVDGLGTKFVSDTGTAGTSDRVFTFDPGTGSLTQVGFLGEATGLPADASNRVYYGNATINTFNAGTIERTSSGGGEAVYRQCGVASTDPCYVWGIGLDPDLTDFGIDGRVYVADGANDKIRLVPPTGLIQDFATGFSFGSPPRGVVVDRDPMSMFYHDVYISDATQVYRYDSAAVPGTLVKTYDPSTFPFVSPRQMALTPTNRVRLLVADEDQGRLVMINPETDASKVINIPLNSPRAIANEHDSVDNVNHAWVGEPDRVLKISVYKTVYLSVWVADQAGISETEVRELVRYANASMAECGMELQIKDDTIHFFNAGTLLDLEVFDSTGTTGCGDPLFQRTAEERSLLENAARRSPETTDLNVYFVRRFTHGASNPGRVGETITEDCFAGMSPGSDATESGIIMSVEALRMNSAGRNVRNYTIWSLGHEIGHALLNRNDWTPGVDEHFARSGAPDPLPANNIMSLPASPSRAFFNEPDQCLNINNDATIFRGDP
jgi:hypothetical protein